MEASQLNLNAEIREKNQTIERLSQDLNSLVTAKDKQVALQAILERNKIKELQALIMRLKSDNFIDKIEEEVDVLVSTIESKGRQINRLKNEKDKATREIKRLNEVIQNQANQIKGLEAEISQ